MTPEARKPKPITREDAQRVFLAMGLNTRTVRGLTLQVFDQEIDAKYKWIRTETERLNHLLYARKKTAEIQGEQLADMHDFLLDHRMADMETADFFGDAVSNVGADTAKFAAFVPRKVLPMSRAEMGRREQGAIQAYSLALIGEPRSVRHVPSRKAIRPNPATLKPRTDELDEAIQFRPPQMDEERIFEFLPKKPVTDVAELAAKVPGVPAELIKLAATGQAISRNADVEMLTEKYPSVEPHLWPRIISSLHAVRTSLEQSTSWTKEKMILDADLQKKELKEKFDKDLQEVKADHAEALEGLRESRKRKREAFETETEQLKQEQEAARHKAMKGHMASLNQKTNEQLQAMASYELFRRSEADQS